MLSNVKTLTPYDLIPNFVALAAWILIEEERGLDKILAQLRRSKKPNLLMDADAQLDKVLARLRLDEPEPRRDVGDAMITTSAAMEIWSKRARYCGALSGLDKGRR
jgi:hypothetical protein